MDAHTTDGPRPEPDVALPRQPDEALLAERARFIRDRLPAQGLFAGQEWRISPEAFPLESSQVRYLEKLGRVLLQFYRAANLLYRKSLEGREPRWVSEWLDLGKPASLLDWQRQAAFKNELPRVIRPDILLTDDGFRISELDSVPGGIGLTAWLNETYSRAAGGEECRLVGGDQGMFEGFAAIFAGASRVHVVISEESSGYRPEMEWLCARLGGDRFAVRDAAFEDYGNGEAVYRFFELFDLANIPAADKIFSLAAEGKLSLTPPPKAFIEEKMLFGLLWNRNLTDFWRRELGEGFLRQLLELVPRTWVVDPTPLPPQGAIPELDLTDWRQLKTLTQRQRNLVLKISGFSEHAWGARGVYVGSDLSTAEWSAAVDRALETFARSPFVLQQFVKPRLVEAGYLDERLQRVVAMTGRVRLCPYYFVAGRGDNARAQLGGALATICPADKKIIHGMSDAIMAPCQEIPDRPA